MAVVITIVLGAITATIQDNTSTGPRIISWEESLETDVAVKSVPTKNSPTVETEIWVSTPRKIIIECRITEEEKEYLETIRSDQNTSSIPSLKEGVVELYDVWIENIESEWDGDKNWIQPWKVRIELTVKS